LGEVIGVVSPSSTANVEGNGDQSPDLLPARVQLLIPASDFVPSDIEVLCARIPPNSLENGDEMEFVRFH
jgi:hypothetical protein